MKINLRIITVTLLCFGSILARGEWSELAPLPERRAAHAAVVVDSLIYIIGGQGGQQHHSSDEFWSYNPETDTWNTDLPPLNNPRSSLTAVVMGDTILVFGGRHMSNIEDVVERYVIGAASWEEIGNMPEPRLGLGSAVIDGKVYLFGGKTSTGMFVLPTDQVDVFDPLMNEWTEGPPLNQARTDFGNSSMENTIICAGGSSVDPLSDVEILEDQTAWTEIAPLDEPRSNSSAVFLDGQFVLLGGYTSEGLSQYNLILVDDQWEEFPEMLLPRYDHTSVELEGNIYVMGGRSGQHPMDSHEYYMPTASVNEELDAMPKSFEVAGPYPNPFNSTFAFSIHLPSDALGNLSMKLIDVRGLLVYEGNLYGTGNGDIIRIDMERLQLGSLSSGIYILQLQWSDTKTTILSTARRIVYLK